jgi:hypothetical protein
LKDPAGILRGSGKQVRSLRLETAGDVQRPEVEALIRQALKAAVAPLRRGRTQLIIRSVSAKQRPRRKPGNRVA